MIVKNILELSKHALNFGEDFVYVATFIKGKNTKKTDVESYRIVFKGTKSGKKVILFLRKQDNFFGRPFIYRIEYLEEGDWKEITPTHYKLKNYNYYEIDSDPNHVNQMFALWKSSDPMVSVGGYMHSFISKINNYDFSYKFNNIKY